MKLVSVIIPAYNCAPYLKRAVDSLLATEQSDLEILIVDDGSTDNTPKVAAECVAASPNIVRQCRHENGANRGASATRNLGIRSSTGEFVCFLDGDDYVYPHRFRTSLPLIRDDESIAAVYELTRLETEDRGPAEECFGDSGFFGLDHPVDSDRLLSTLLSGPIWHANSILIRRSFLIQTGVFCEALRTAEDCHLWYRMAALGRVIPGNFDQPVSSYCRRQGSLFRPSLESRRELMRAMGMFVRWLRRVDAARQLRCEVVERIGANFERAITEARRSGSSRQAWHMAWHAARHFPSIMRHSTYWRQLAHIAMSPIRTDPLLAAQAR